MRSIFCRFLISILFCSSVISVSAIELDFKIELDSIEEERISAPLFLVGDSISNDSSSNSPFVPKKRKLKAVLLSVFLGHFGVHRIYLGTKANVPVAYSLTLGGGLGLLPFIDTIMILQSKDLEEFSNNDKVIMWSKQKATQP